MVDEPIPDRPDRRPVWYLAHGLVGDQLVLAHAERIGRRVEALCASRAVKPDPVGTLILEPLTEPHEGVRLFRVHDGVKTLLARQMMIAALADIAFQHRAYNLAIQARPGVMMQAAS